jgi:hypothetical protein
MTIHLSKSEYRLLSNIGLSAGEVSFASLFASLFVFDKNNIILVISSLVLTLLFGEPVGFYQGGLNYD